MLRFSRLLPAGLMLPLLAQAQEQEAVFRAETRLVVLHATVVDSKGHLVTNLPQKAFKVLENGAEQQIKVFKREDIPVSIGIVIDNSGSMKNKRLKVEAASLQLVKASHPQDEVFIVNFNDEAFLDTKDFTNDMKELEEALTKIDSRGGTAMRDAVRMSIDFAKEKGKKDKKVLLVITDGDDNNSTGTLENLVKAAQQSEILIYSIGLLQEEERRAANKAKRALIAISDATGGVAYFPKELEEVDKIAHDVARDIRSQYVIAYSPSNQELDGSYRQIKVQVSGPGRPVCRTRSGYYATAQGSTKAPARPRSGPIKPPSFK
ncbi:MAG: VWA domain-containing protein [Candidatus Solibacter usitatus]|nr:VWA domain-containing protein [Candidatus Solibacter usitatus]